MGLLINLKDFFWKLLLGLIPFATIVPLVLQSSGDFFSISPKTGFTVFLCVFFIGPILIWAIWWYLQEGEWKFLGDSRISRILQPGYYVCIAGQLFIAAICFLNPSKPILVKLFFLLISLVIIWTIIFDIVMISKAVGLVSISREASPVQRIDSQKSVLILLEFLLYILAISLFLILFLKRDGHEGSNIKLSKSSALFDKADLSEEEYQKGIFLTNFHEMDTLHSVLLEKYNHTMDSLYERYIRMNGSVQMSDTITCDTILLGHLDDMLNRVKKQINIFTNLPNDSTKQTFRSPFDSVKADLEKIRFADRSKTEKLYAIIGSQEDKWDAKVKKAYADAWKNILSAMQFRGILLNITFIFFLVSLLMGLYISNIHPKSRQHMPDLKRKNLISGIQNFIVLFVVLIICIFKQVDASNIMRQDSLWLFRLSDFLYANDNRQSHLQDDDASQKKKTPSPSDALTRAQLEEDLQALSRKIDNVSNNTKQSNDGITGIHHLIK